VITARLRRHLPPSILAAREGNHCWRAPQNHDDWTPCKRGLLGRRKPRTTSRPSPGGSTEYCLLQQTGELHPGLPLAVRLVSPLARRPAPRRIVPTGPLCSEPTLNGVEVGRQLPCWYPVLTLPKRGVAPLEVALANIYGKAPFFSELTEKNKKLRRDSTTLSVYTGASTAEQGGYYLLGSLDDRPSRSAIGEAGEPHDAAAARTRPG